MDILKIHQIHQPKCDLDYMIPKGISQTSTQIPNIYFFLKRKEQIQGTIFVVQVGNILHKITTVIL